MSFQLAGDDLERMKAALALLNAVKHQYGVDVCAYGGIDVEVEDGQYMRLEYIETIGYHFTECFR